VARACCCQGRCCTLLLYRPAARLVARPGEVLGTGSPTVRFSGRTHPQLAWIVRVLCAVGGRCCQPLAAAAVAVTVAGGRGPVPHLQGLPSVVTAPCPPQAPPPNPTAAEPDGRRVLSRVGVADHAVTPQAPWTGSGCREYSYGGFGGGHPPSARIPAASTAISSLSAWESDRSWRVRPLTSQLGRPAAAVIDRSLPWLSPLARAHPGPSIPPGSG